MLRAEDKKELKQLGLNVKRLRTAKGLSHRQLSHLCRLEHNRIIEIEQGKVNITYITLLELASGLEVHPAEIITLPE